MIGVEKDEPNSQITTLFMREQSGRKECFFMPKYKATAYILSLIHI